MVVTVEMKVTSVSTLAIHSRITNQCNINQCIHLTSTLSHMYIVHVRAYTRHSSEPPPVTYLIPSNHLCPTAQQLLHHLTVVTSAGPVEGSPTILQGREEDEVPTTWTISTCILHVFTYMYAHVQCKRLSECMNITATV